MTSVPSKSQRIPSEVIEQRARSLCRTAGFDPDHQEPYREDAPSPPKWMSYFDAALRSLRTKPAPAASREVDTETTPENIVRFKDLMVARRDS